VAVAVVSLLMVAVACASTPPNMAEAVSLLAVVDVASAVSELNEPSPVA